MPGLFTIGRKDSLWRGFQEMTLRWGEKRFGFLPRTFVLPEDREQLEQRMRQSSRPMIVKPPNWFCGIGIKLINKIGSFLNLREIRCATNISFDGSF